MNFNDEDEITCDRIIPQKRNPNHLSVQNPTQNLIADLLSLGGNGSNRED